MTPTATRLILQSRYPATRAGVAAALADFDRLAPATVWPGNIPNTLRLAIEELIINAVDHGGQSPLDGWFVVRISETPSMIELTVEDAGAPFDPTRSREPDIDESIDERAIGGLGLHLVRSLADEFSYQRVGDMNRAVLVFNSTPT